MRLLIATDAWRPQVNGVVRTLERTGEELRLLGIDVSMLTPAEFKTWPLPTYPEIRLARAMPRTIGAAAAAARPDAVHIATEGPIGFAVRRWCLAESRPFTTSFHTRFPEYLSARAPIPERLTYALLRRFHNAGRACMVATETLRGELAARGFEHIVPWTRGVDSTLFHPREGMLPDLPRPVFLFVGRVAVEKSIGDFLALDLPGSKVVVGDGPALPSLRAEYPEAHFLGVRTGEALAEVYAGADVFVFPSRTDTFGIVLLEALASGVPVAAYPVAGPLDVVGGTDVGILDHDLRAAALAALKIPRDRCRAFAVSRSWRASAEQFLANIVAANDLPPERVAPRVAKAAAR